MSRRLFVFVFFLGSLPSCVAFAKDAPAPALGVSLRALKTSGSTLEGLSTVQSSKALEPKMVSVAKGEDLRTSVRREPMDLWLVLDNSALCAKHKADQTLATWAAKLARELPSASRLSLLTFRRGSFEMLATQLPSGELPLGKVRCQPGAVSSESERALAYVTETDVPAGLTRAVWVLSSGNVSVSAKMQARLKETGTELSFFLYNPFVFSALAPLFDSLRAALGEGLFYAQAVEEGTAELPARTYRVQASIPRGLGSNAAFAAKAADGDLKAQSAAATVKLPPLTGPSFWEQFFSVLYCLALVGALVYCVYRVIHHYRPRHCSTCQQRLRFGDAVCPFCFERDGAYLIASNPLGQGAQVVRPLVATLHGENTQVGTHRKSALRCLRRRGERRRLYFKVQRKSESFRLQAGAQPVFINGLPVHGARYLASGDRISVGDSGFQFIQNRRSHQSA